MPRLPDGRSLTIFATIDVAGFLSSPRDRAHYVLPVVRGRANARAPQD